MNIFIIKDWAGNILFNEKEFKSFDDAEEFLCENFRKNNFDYDDNRGELEIVNKKYWMKGYDRNEKEDKEQKASRKTKSTRRD